MATNGNLKLTSQQFASLKTAIDSLTATAEKAKIAISEIFQIDAQVDKLNAKLAIMNARISNIFQKSAKEWKKTAESIEKMSQKMSSAGKGGKGGLGSSGGKGGAGGGSGGSGAGGAGGEDVWLMGSKLKSNASVTQPRSKHTGFGAFGKGLNPNEGTHGYSTSLNLASNLGTYINKIKKETEKISKSAKKPPKEPENTPERVGQSARSPIDSRFAGRVKEVVDKILESQLMKSRLGQAARYAFGLPNNYSQRTQNKSGNNPLGSASRFFGSAGTIGSGMIGKFRVFQKPFPGSERNVFANGDLAAGFNNMVHGAGSTLENSFRLLTMSSSGLLRSFSAVSTSAISLVPVFGPLIGGVLRATSDLMIGVFEKLASVVGSVIGGLTKLATSLTGFATRAIESASNFTEAINAARVVSGNESASQMSVSAIRFQREYGLSATDIMKGMARMSGMLVQQGSYSQKEAGNVAIDMMKNLADIASVNNTSIDLLVKDALSGFAGRFTPFRKDMISLQAPQLDAMAKARGMSDPSLRTDLTARLKMAVEEITRQAGLFSGDLERTRYEFANQRRKILGGFEAMFLSIGRILEPFGKAVLIVANSIMDDFLSVIDSITSDPYESFKSSIQEFASYLIQAKNVVKELAKEIWNSRGSIAKSMSYVADIFVKITVSLLKVSLNLVSTFAQIGTAIVGLFPIIRFFGETLSALGNMIHWITGVDSQKTSDLKKDLSNAESAIKSSGGISRTGPMGFKATKKTDEMQQSLIAKRDDLIDKLNQSMAYDKKNDLHPQFKEWSKKLQGFADNPEKVMENSTAFLEKHGINLDELNKQTNDLLSKIQPVNSNPGKITPPPPLTTTGQMVRYFDPAAFRDAIQERDVASAQMRTADNTEAIKNILMRDNVRISPQKPFDLLNTGMTTIP